MRYRRKLFGVKHAFDTRTTEDLFVLAMRENCQFHYDHCAPYRRILQHYQFSPDGLTGVDDLARLPCLPTLLFKRHRLYSLPRRRMLIRATSSGTSGQFSEIGFEPGGLLCGLEMVLRIGRLRGLFSPVPCHYILFGYQPHRGNRTAVTKTAFGATLFTPALSRTYALRYSNGAYSADLDHIIRAIVRHARSRFPLRMMGFPSYTYFTLKKMQQQGIRLTLARGSKILLGGGWKQFYTEQVDKQTFYSLAAEVLGLADADIVEFFGAVEHPILYCDCARHHFHVPAYSRVLIRDVQTLAPLPNGQPGLVNLLTPMVAATPILSVMTDDLGVLHDGAECGCGLDSPYLEILGRVGLRDIKTCAAGAAELLEKLRL